MSHPFGGCDFFDLWLVDVDRCAAGLTAKQSQILCRRLMLDRLICYLHLQPHRELALLSLFVCSFGADGLAALHSRAPNSASTESEPARQLHGLHTIGLLHEALVAGGSHDVPGGAAGDKPVT